MNDKDDGKMLAFQHVQQKQTVDFIRMNILNVDIVLKHMTRKNND